MRKLVFILMLLLACAFGAQADVLYWMVDTKSADDCGMWTYATFTASPSEGGVAVQLGWKDDSSVYHYYKDDFGVEAMGSVFPIAAANGDNYTYLIELWNGEVGNADIVGQAMYSYEDIQSYVEMSVLSPVDGAFLASGFAAVPEPTSGLLFLMGGVLLGIRRRRMA